MPKTPTPAQQLGEIRAALGLTQEAMAKAVGASHRSYHRWEVGETRVPAEALLAAYKLRDAAKKRGA